MARQQTSRTVKTKKQPAKRAPAPKAAPKNDRARASTKAPKKASASRSALAGRRATAGAKANGKAKKAVAREPSAGSKRVAEGDRAPAFRASDQEGRTVSSSDLKGKPYVLYFYPKDDTPGCTREACTFRDLLPRFLSKRVEVLGVSPDSVESHDRFKNKYGLNFRLLSDRDKALCEAYGVWVKKQNYGREYMGVERSTFLIDQKGVVRKAWRKVKVDGHGQDVLAALSDLG
jgi:peroxiredoxin Q/BCP